MKTFDSERWVRLATAAVNARDALRELIPQIDKALRTPSESDVELLQKVRGVAHRHADSLRLGLKHPS